MSTCTHTSCSDPDRITSDRLSDRHELLNVWHILRWHPYIIYRQVSNIRRTKSQHLKDSCTVSRLSLPNPLKPDVKSRMKMELEQHRQAMLQLHLSDRQFYCLLTCVLYYRFYGTCICTLYPRKYRKASNIRGTQSPNFSDSRVVLQLSLANPLKPAVKPRMKM